LCPFFKKLAQKEDNRLKFSLHLNQFLENLPFGNVPHARWAEVNIEEAANILKYIYRTLSMGEESVAAGREHL